MKTKYFINSLNELVDYKTDKTYYSDEFYPLKHESGCYNYIVLGDTPVLKTIEQLEQEKQYRDWYFNKYDRDSLDKFLWEGYCTFGKSLDAILLSRFNEKFNIAGQTIYRQEFHKLEDFDDIESSVNFGWNEQELPKFSDKGVIFVKDPTKDASIILNTGKSFSKCVLGGISMVMEAGYNFQDIGISFIKNEEEYPLIPFGYAPFSAFGYCVMPEGDGTVKVKVELKSNLNVNKRAVFSDIRIVAEV